MRSIVDFVDRGVREGWWTELGRVAPTGEMPRRGWPACRRGAARIRRRRCSGCGAGRSWRSIRWPGGWTSIRAAHAEAPRHHRGRRTAGFRCEELMDPAYSSNCEAVGH